jgi:regulator of RNase E activity RraA
MGDEDTVVLTPEEKDKILSDVSEEEEQEEEKEDES